MPRNIPRLVFRLAAPWVMAGLSLLAPSFATAEVGAIVNLATGSSKGSYEIGIVDDPDPFVWDQLSPVRPGLVALNPGGRANGDGKPSLVFNALTGTPLAAWSRNSATGRDIVVSHFAAGSWSEPQVVAGSAADEVDPVLVVHPTDGSLHVVYWIADASPRVMYRWAAADLSSWSGATQISAPGSIACRPSAVFEGLSLRVAYEAHDSGLGSIPRRLVLAKLEGQSVLEETLAITSHAGPNWPQVHRSVNGRLWIDWIDSDGEMTWRRQVDAGPWEPVQVEPFETPEQRDYRIRGGIGLQALQ